MEEAERVDRDEELQYPREERLCYRNLVNSLGIEYEPPNSGEGVGGGGGDVLCGCDLGGIVTDVRRMGAPDLEPRACGGRR